MKRIILPLFCILNFTFLSFAQVITVSNAVNTPGQFSNLQLAIDAAQPGDTIYVHGATYGNITVNKTLTIIGPGYNAQGQFTARATIPTIFLDRYVPATTASGSRFIGLNIGSIGTLSSNQFVIDDIVFERCRFYANSVTEVLGNGWVFKNNFFDWPNEANGVLSINYYNRILITNNMFNSRSGNRQIRNSNKRDVIIRNNIFTGSFENANQFLNISNAHFSYNIFFGKSPQGATFSSFEYNITYGEIPFMNLPYGSNFGTTNLVNVNPQFVFMPPDNSMYVFSHEYDYRLKDISLGKSVGPDSTEVGIFGGPYPMPTHNLKFTGEPRIPQIYYMNLQNNVVDQNTPINVTIKARKMD